MGNSTRDASSKTLLGKISFWLLVAGVAFVVLAPDTALAQVELGEAKLVSFRGALRKVAIVAIGIAGLLTGVYISFGRQDGNERLAAVVKGAIVVSIVVSAVTYLAG